MMIYKVYLKKPIKNIVIMDEQWRQIINTIQKVKKKGLFKKKLFLFFSFYIYFSFNVYKSTFLNDWRFIYINDDFGATLNQKSNFNRTEKI